MNGFLSTFHGTFKSSCTKEGVTWLGSIISFVSPIKNHMSDHSVLFELKIIDIFSFI
jgi:hypothetical protein